MGASTVDQSEVWWLEATWNGGIGTRQANGRTKEEGCREGRRQIDERTGEVNSQGRAEGGGLETTELSSTNKKCGIQCHARQLREVVIRGGVR